MIKDVEILDIRQMYKDGMAVTDIALATGYCDKTIRKWLRREESPRYRRSKRPSKLDPYKEYIMRRMDEGVFNCEVLLRELKERGYEGSRTILREFVSPFRRQFKIQAVRRFETLPGEQSQVDWSYLGEYQLDGRLRKVWCFVLVLGYSRFLTAHCTTSMDLETFLLSHQKCFEQIGGIPERMIYDNMKTVTTGRDIQNRSIWHPRFMDFALYYGFQPRTHRPYYPQSKGKVERSIGYIKQNFCPGRTFEDLSDLNRQLQTWLDQVANQRIHSTTGERPLARLLEETLEPLPQRPFATCIRFPRRVSREGYVSYLGTLYSVPWPYAGCEVMVEEQVDQVLVIYWHEQPIAEHILARDGTRYQSLPEHFVGLQSAQKRSRASGLRQCYPEVQTRPLEVYDQWAVAE